MTLRPRQLRVEYPGTIDHLLSRGDRRKDICLEAVDRQSRRCGIKTLAEACQSRLHRDQVLAYGLMRNHFHLVVETHTCGLEALVL